MKLRPGMRLASSVCSTAVVVVRAPGADVDLRCGGAPMVPHDADRATGGEPSRDFSAGTLVGKRYWLEGSDLELMCTAAGDGSLSVGDQPLELKPAKPLPSSD